MSISAPSSLANTLSADDSIEPLLSACSTNDLLKLQSLLATSHQADLALSSRTVRYNSTNVTFPVTRLMLEASCRTGASSTAAYVLSFAHQNSLPPSDLIAQDGILAAIDSPSPLALFTEFVHVLPTAVNMPLGHMGDPLSYALHKDQKGELVAYLLTHGANPNAPCAAHKGPGHHLRLAAGKSPLQTVNLLLEHGAQVPRSGAMHMAAEKGRLDVLETLVAHEGDVNEILDVHLGFLGRPGSDAAKKRASETPVMVAARCGQEDAKRWLLAHGAKRSGDSEGPVTE